jgi:thioredoxin 1
MNRAILMQLIIGLALGGGLGAIMGYFGKCTTGACPLTANPWRGAFMGALMGGLLAFSMGSSRTVAEAGTGRHAAVLITSEADFDHQVLNATQPVLVDFYSDSCGPCRMLAPTIEKLAKQYEGRALVCKVNVDQFSALAERHGIQGIPTVVFFDNGKEVQRLVGLRSQSAYTEVLDKLAGQPS